MSLDEKASRVLEKYERKNGSSKAEVVRKALSLMEKIDAETQHVSVDTIIKYVDYLATMEHLILDVSHWECSWSEIGEGSDDFWREMHEVGKSHREEYWDKNIRQVKDILEHVEKTNWYRLTKNSEHSYTLTMSVPRAKRFVKVFFEGFFADYPQKVTITESTNKLKINILQ